jgi:molybdenum cofactor cytidylyltransferase
LAVAHKLLAPLRGETVFTRSLRNLLDSMSSSAISEVLVIQGAIDLSDLVEQVVGSRNLNVRLLTNDQWAKGQASSLALAIDVSTQPQTKPGPDSMIVGLGDQPFIPAETWAAVANAPVQHQIVVATYGGLRRNPVRINAKLWGEIPRTGDEGARPLLRKRPDLVYELPCHGDPADIDTVEDLLRWS